MLTAVVEGGDGVIAWATNKQAGPFLCPQCDREVILKQGKVRVHHFAHAVETDCDHGAGETHEHLHAKRSIYEALSRNERVTKLALERGLGSVRPDISCRIDGIPVAIEVQRSKLNIETVRHRFAEYSQKGIALMWVLLSPPSTLPTEARTWERKDCIRLRDWQKFLKDVYYNHLYYFVGGDQVSVFRFSRWQEEKDLGWDEDSYEHTHRGIVTLKHTWRTLYTGTFSIAEHGASHKRKYWQEIPAGWLWQIAG